MTDTPTAAGALVITATQGLNGADHTAPVPAAETMTHTKRQRLYHVLALNAARFDWQLRPLMAEMDTLPVAERAAMRVLLSLASRAMKLDFMEHPSAILLLLVHVLDDETFSRLWADLSPLLTWVSEGID